MDCVDDYYLAAKYDINDCLLIDTTLFGSAEVE